MQTPRSAIIFLLIGAASARAATLDQAQQLWLRGNYGEALDAYAAVKGADAVVVAMGKARCLRSQGKYAEALAELSAAAKGAPKHGRLLAELADLTWHLGRLAEADDYSKRSLAADPDQLLARWVHCQLLAARGQSDQCARELESFIKYYNEKQPTDPETLLLVARGAAEHARRTKLHDQFDFIINDLLPDALKANESFWPASCFAGLLFIEKYNKADGVPELKKALAVNPSAADVMVGLGAAAFQDFDLTEARHFAEQALKVDPNLPEAHCLLADLHVADGRLDDAVAALELALKTNPVREETLGRLTACRILARKMTDADRIEREVLRRNPKPGVFYLAVADQLENRRQFSPAEKYYRMSSEAAPFLAGANGLGLLYMRVGKEDEARKVFVEARQLDPYHVRVLNFTKVLKHMEEYRPILSAHYEVWVHPGKDQQLGEYMSEFLESKHDELCKRFGYHPKERTKIEILVDHPWFSARVVGLPSIGTVGACTGNVVALASPRSLQSPYNWARVLVHEVTHILTLQQTNFNIPHWYTEALAVMSEGFDRPQIWNQTLVERVPKGELLTLANINQAFARPNTLLDWQMAYCQSLLYAQYMVEKHGPDSLARMLSAYRDGLETPAAIQHALGTAVDKFEAGYLEYLKKLVATLKTGSSPGARSFAEIERAFRADPENAGLAAELAVQHLRRKNNSKARELAESALKRKPNHPVALFVLARLELSIGKIDEALKILEPAFEPANPNEQVVELLAAIRLRRKQYDDAFKLFDAAHQRDPLNQKWVEGMSQAALRAGDEARTAASLLKLAQMDSDTLSVRKKLAELEFKKQHWARSEHWALQALYIDTNDADAHRLLGQSALRQKKHRLAAVELARAGAADGGDPKLAIELAEAYLGDKRKADAKALLERVLQKDPASERAKQLLKESTGP